LVVLQVDMRYRSINNSNFSIAVQLNGYYVATVTIITGFGFDLSLLFIVIFLACNTILKQ